MFVCFLPHTAVNCDRIDSWINRMIGFQSETHDVEYKSRARAQLNQNKHQRFLLERWIKQTYLYLNQ